ncbi:sulfatase [Galbibacter mesophilus]|uniref:sulfatase n=1 Tax=Galbibacter mesophilus TaxID=379069 RepID=UPI001F5E11BC|nr:sulfatase [Galbibacter mesophilus]MCM5663062.1 sulfatase [Galbibacter mesophilus]
MTKSKNSLFYLLKKVNFFCIVSMLIIGCKSEVSKEIKEEKVKPNIVFILADDLGAHDLSISGSNYYETPNIDKIAKEGTIFTQGYAGSRVCSPSRATIMLGKSPARHGITDWIGAASGENWRKHKRNDKLLPPEYVHALPAADTTLAEALKAGGYSTFFAGKWHLGEEPSNPENSGFDINKGGWDVGSPKGGYFSPWKNPKLPNEEPGENLSMRLAKETNKFIESNKSKPFFAMLSFYAVHSPIQTSEEKWKKYREKAVAQGIKESGFEMERVLPIRTQQDNPVYAGLVEQMDDAVGAVLDKLKELGIEDNTIIVFTSDNGGVASGDAFSTSNLPLRGGKGYQWEGGIREPYFIKVPFIENAPKEIGTPVTAADFFPTLIDFAGLNPMPNQTKDGVSLKPLFENGKISERPLFWHYPHYGNQGGEPSSIIRKGNFKLIHYYEDGRNELYDLSEDPNEQNDISAEEKERVSLLENELMMYLKSTNAKIPTKDPKYDPELAKEIHKNRVEVLMPRLEKERKEMLSKDYQPNETWWDSKITKD